MSPIIDINETPVVKAAFQGSIEKAQKDVGLEKDLLRFLAVKAAQDAHYYLSIYI